MDTTKGKDEQTAKILAFLLRCEIREDCTPEDLSSACRAFSVTPAEIRRLCALPNSALRLIKDETVGVSQSFSSFIEKLFLTTSFTSLLSCQNFPPNDSTKHGLVPPWGNFDSQNYPPKDSTKHGLVPDWGNVDGEIVKLGLKPEPTVARSNFDGVNTVNAVTEIRPWVSSTVLLPTGYALATNNGSIEYFHDARPSTGLLPTGNGLATNNGIIGYGPDERPSTLLLPTGYELATNNGSIGFIHDERPSTLLLPTGYELATNNGSIGFIHDDRPSTILLPVGYGLSTNHGSIGYVRGEKPSNRSQRTESHHSAHDGNPSNHLQRIEKVHIATPEGIFSKSLQRIEKAHIATPEEILSKSLQRTENCHLATHIENPSHPLQRQEKLHIATEAACLVEQGVVSLANDINAQQKKKSRDPRSAPRFEDYTVDGEVGAGGYGTVYKVRRRIDGQIFAIKCPLENTSNSCVRNEINMLKRLRGKDNIIRFKGEVIGKMSRTPEAGGGEDIDCPSILLEFIEHDKPEVLKKEITIDELKCYSSSLFKALAQLHRQQILHLDVKPGNFLFSRSTKRGCLVDFNLARVSYRKPERGPSRAGNEAKIFDRKKRSLGHENTTLTPSKRSRISERRRILEGIYPDLPLTTDEQCIGDQRKEIVRPAASKDISVASPKDQLSPQLRSNPATGAITASIKHEPSKVNDCLVDTSSAQQVGTPKTQQIPRGHRLFPFSPSGPSALKLNPSKRIPAGAPQHQAVAQPTYMKGVKPAIKVKVGAPRQLVKDGPCVGTKGYRAPEVLMRSTKQTTRVDIWSAGVSLLQLVTGKSPFPSSSTDGALKDIARLRGSTKMDKLAKSLGQRPRFLKDAYQGTPVKDWSEKNSRRPDLKGRVPSALYDLIERCLEVNPDSRITAEAALQHQFCITDTSELWFN